MNYTTTIRVRRKQHKSFVRKILTLAVIGFILFVALVAMAGCTPKVSTPDPAASQAAPPVVSEEPEPAAEAPVDNLPLLFGETATWLNDVSISVSQPTAFDPTDMAAGMVDGNTSVAIEFVLTNNSTENYEPMVYNSASSAGVEAPGIFDVEKNIGLPPTTTVLPGKTIKWTEAYSVADAADITLEVSVGFEYDSVIYTTSK